MTRAQALSWASEIRNTRNRVRTQLASEQLGLGELLKLAKQDEAVGEVKLLWALESLPGARKVDTRRKLAELRIPGTLRLGDLDVVITDRIITAFLLLAQSPARS